MNRRLTMGDWRRAAALVLAAGASALAQPVSSPMDDIPPLAPPLQEIPPSFWEQHSTAVLLGVLALLVLVGLAIWWWCRPKPPVLVPPEVRARAELAALGKQPEDGLVISRVSQVLRRYLNAAFNLPPGESTTAELCATLSRSETIGPELAAAVGEFLRASDERKFAPAAGGEPFRAVSRALALVEQAEARRAHLRAAAGPAPSA